MNKLNYYINELKNEERNDDPRFVLEATKHNKNLLNYASERIRNECDMKDPYEVLPKLIIEHDEKQKKKILYGNIQKQLKQKPIQKEFKIKM